MQTCYNCGRQVDDNVLICPECGALVRRYGKPEPPRPEMAEAPDCAPQPAARAARSKRLPAGAKIWLILCIVVNAIQVFGFVNLFYLYGNQSLFSDVFAAYPELAPMQELLGTLMQSVSLFFWFYVLEASLCLRSSRRGCCRHSSASPARPFYTCSCASSGPCLPNNGLRAEVRNL